MSAWGAFAGGVGGAAAGIASKYIDEELMQQRAQALSDMQFANSKRTEEYTQSEAVQGRRLSNLGAEQKQTSANALEAQRTQANDEVLQSGLRKNALAVKQGEREQTNANTIADAGNKPLMAAYRDIKLNDPEVGARLKQAAAAIAASGASVTASNEATRGSRMRNDGFQLELDDKKALSTLVEQGGAVLGDTTLTEQQRGAAMAKIGQQMSMIRSKYEKPGGGEYDNVKIKTEATDPKTGEITTTERTERRKPGAQGDQQEQAPRKPAGPWDKYMGSQTGQGAEASKPATPPSPAPPASRSLLEVARANERKPDSIDLRREEQMKPLVADLNEKKAAFKRAALSGNPQAIAAAQGPMVEAKRLLMQTAEKEFGNGAQRFLSTVITE